jgi:AraC family transcriptional regulator
LPHADRNHDQIELGANWHMIGALCEKVRMSAIAKTVWLLESRLFEPITLDDVANHAGVSRTHISHIFPAATGFSISGYLRARRLSEAAKLLADGAPDILSVALEAGYGSHEAFTRAFGDQFGKTPEAVRRQRSLVDLNLVEPLLMDDTLKLKLDAPIIDDHADMLFAGLKARHTMTTSNTLPLQWQKFQQYLGHIPGGIGHAAYAVVGDMPEGCDDFEYFTAVEISGKGELPSELETLRLPAQRFARFTHHGHISTIRSTIGAIYEKWPPRLGRSANGTFSFIEYYGPDFDPVRGEGTVEIWIAVDR